MPDSLADSGALKIVNDVREYTARVEEQIARAPGGTSETALVLLGVTLREIGHALRSVMLTASAVKKLYRSGFSDGHRKGREEGYAAGYAAALAAAGRNETAIVPLQSRPQLVRDAG